MGEKQAKNEYNIRSSKDIVSGLMAPVNAVKNLFNPKNKEKDRNITVKAETSNILKEHSPDILDRIDENALIGGFSDQLINSYQDLSGGLMLGELKVYQIKELIPQFLKKYTSDENIKDLKGWYKKKKAELIKILRSKGVNPDDYTLSKEDPNKGKYRSVGDVRKKYGVKEYTDADQEAFLLNIVNNPRYSNPLQALGQYTNKENVKEYLTLQKHQRDFVRQFIFSNLRGAIAYHGVGSGKTLTAVVCAYYYLKMYPKNRVIVVSPSALLYNFVNGMVQYGLTIQDNRYQFFTYDKYIKYIKKPNLIKNALVIIDEAHNLRTEIVVNPSYDPETGEEREGGEPVSNKRGYYIMQFGTNHAHKVLLLTGTAFVNGLYDIENLLSIVDKRTPLNRSTYSEVIGNKLNIPDYFGYRISYFKSPESDLFPYRREFIEPVVMNDKQEKEYNKIKSEGRPELGSENPNAFFSAERYASNYLDAYSSVGSPKIDWVVKAIQGIIPNEKELENMKKDELEKIKKQWEEKKKQKFIIYSSLYDAGIKLLKNELDKLKIKYTEISGAQSVGKKEEAKRYFNGYDFGKPNFFNKELLDAKTASYINSEYRVLLITKAGAEGVDTINCQNIILLDSQWNDATSEQIIARAIRYKSHHGLLREERYVNVYRLLLVKKANMAFVNEIKKKGFNDWIQLHKEVKNDLAENNKQLKIDEKTYIPTVKELKEIKKPNGTPYIPEDGWDKYKKLKTDKERKVWRLTVFNEYNKNKVRDLTPLSGMTVDLYMLVLSKSKLKNIEDFTADLGKDISLFESYQSKLLPIVEAEIKKLEKVKGSKLTTDEVDKTEAKIYAELLSKQNILTLKIQEEYENKLKESRTTQARLQQYFTNVHLAEYLREKSSISKAKDKIIVLEPTAGEGALIKPILELKKDLTIEMVEMDKKNREHLNVLANSNKNSLKLLENYNFLTFVQSDRYDYIYMNPPFHLKQNENASQNRDIWDVDFIIRAFAMLKKGGELLAISGYHWTFANDKPSKDFRDFLDLDDKKYEIITSVEGDIKKYPKLFSGELKKDKLYQNIENKYLEQMRKEGSRKKNLSLFTDADPNITIIKITKLSSINNDENLKNNCYKNNFEEKGKAILENTAPIEVAKVDLPKQPETIVKPQPEIENEPIKPVEKPKINKSTKPKSTGSKTTFKESPLIFEDEEENPLQDAKDEILQKITRMNTILELKGMTRKDKVLKLNEIDGLIRDLKNKFKISNDDLNKFIMLVREEISKLPEATLPDPNEKRIDYIL